MDEAEPAAAAGTPGAAAAVLLLDLVSPGVASPTPLAVPPPPPKTRPHAELVTELRELQRARGLEQRTLAAQVGVPY